MNDYAPVQIDDDLKSDLRRLLAIAVSEDLGDQRDWTTALTIDSQRHGGCDVVSRSPGVAAGLVLVDEVFAAFGADIDAEICVGEGEPLPVGEPLIRLRGPAAELLTTERVLLNLLSRMCGVATLTQTYVAKIGNYKARLYDTRKTTPGWRRLEKYAVRIGGGHNHRTGLFDGVLVKDNHLALGGWTARDAAAAAVAGRAGGERAGGGPSIVEIEVDTIDQLRDVLTTGVDIVLCDNFSFAQLRDAVAIRDRIAPGVELEASGNVSLATISQTAATGVDRISAGALTHQATWLDLGMDWSS